MLNDIVRSWLQFNYLYNIRDTRNDNNILKTTPETRARARSLEKKNRRCMYSTNNCGFIQLYTFADIQKIFKKCHLKNIMLFIFRSRALCALKRIIIVVTYYPIPICTYLIRLDIMQK